MDMEAANSDPDSQRGIHVDVVRRARAAGLSDTRIRTAVQHVLRRHGVRDAQIEVAIVGEAAIRQLHTQYLGQTGTTDVITFDLAEHGSAAEAQTVAGQINVCWPVAKREAAKRGLKAAHELLLYIVHGLLHLLGYDDLSEAQAARMHRREDELLAELGYGPVYALEGK